MHKQFFCAAAANGDGQGPSQKVRLFFSFRDRRILSRGNLSATLMGRPVEIPAQVVIGIGEITLVRNITVPY